MKKSLLSVVWCVFLGVSCWAGPLFWERAEDLSGVVVTATGDYSVLAGDGVAVEGAGAFHLAHATSADQLIEIRDSLAIVPGSFLFFESRLGWAGSAQTAWVEVSTDGAVWTPIWSRQGTGDAGQDAFERVQVDLAAYAGQELRLRFRYALGFGNYFPQSSVNPLVGWLIDDIQIGTNFYIEPVLYSIGNPTDLEQFNLEMINRARASAAAEALRLRDTDDPDVVSAVAFFNVNTVLMIQQFATLAETAQPLAFNERLLQAARLHSEDMLNNAFQSHTSSAQPVPPNQPGDSMADRLTRQGYQFWTAGENVYAYARSMWHAHAGFNIDWGATASGGSVGGMQDPPGHREAIHNPLFREVGIGVVAGSNGGVGPYLVTQNFGTELTRNAPFLTGVAFRDLNQNGFYDPGEGIGGVRVDVVGERFTALTTQSGGYAVPLSGNGEFQVVFTYLDGRQWIQTVTVADDLNVKVDFDPALLAASEPTLRLAVAPNGEVHVYLADSAQSLLLQSSTDLVHWIDRPDLTPTSVAANAWRYTLAVEDTVFVRAVVTAQ